MLLSYFLTDSEMVSVVPIITGIAFVFTFHIRCITVVRSLHFKISQLYTIIIIDAFYLREKLFYLTLRLLMSYIYIYILYDISSLRVNDLTLILLTWIKW